MGTKRTQMGGKNNKSNLYLFSDCCACILLQCISCGVWFNFCCSYKYNSYDSKNLSQNGTILFQKCKTSKEIGLYGTILGVS